MKKKNIFNLVIGSLSISSILMVSVVTSCGSKDSGNKPGDRDHINIYNFKQEKYTKKTDIGDIVMQKGASINANIYENDSFKYVFDDNLFPKAGSSTEKLEWDVKFAQQLNNTLLEWGPGNFFNKLNDHKSTIIFKSADTKGYSFGGDFFEVVLMVPTNDWTNDTLDEHIEGYVGLTFHEVGHQNNAFAFYSQKKDIFQIIKENAVDTLDSAYSDFSKNITIWTDTSKPDPTAPDTALNEKPTTVDGEYILKLFGNNPTFKAIWEANKGEPMIENEGYVTSSMEIATRIMESLSYVNGSKYTYNSVFNLPDREPLFTKHWFNAEIFKGGKESDPTTSTLNSGFQQFVEENLGFYAQKPVAQAQGYSMKSYDPSSTDTNKYVSLTFNSKTTTMNKVEIIKNNAIHKIFNKNDILQSEIKLPIKKYASSISDYSLDTWKYSGIRLPNEAGYSYKAWDSNDYPITITV